VRIERESAMADRSLVPVVMTGRSVRPSTDRRTCGRPSLTLLIVANRNRGCRDRRSGAARGPTERIDELMQHPGHFAVLGCRSHARSGHGAAGRPAAWRPRQAGDLNRASTNRAPRHHSPGNRISGPAAGRPLAFDETEKRLLAARSSERDISTPGPLVGDERPECKRGDLARAAAGRFRHAGTVLEARGVTLEPVHHDLLDPTARYQPTHRERRAPSARVCRFSSRSCGTAASRRQRAGECPSARRPARCDPSRGRSDRRAVPRPQRRRPRSRRQGSGPAGPAESFDT